MRHCRIKLTKRCQRLISRAEWHTVRLKGASGESEGLRTTMTRKTYCGNLLWQSGLTLLAQKGGKVSFVANTARDSAEATCYYEIIRIWYN